MTFQDLIEQIKENKPNTLVLYQRHIKEEEAKQLSSILKSYSHIKTVTIEKCILTPLSTKILAEALQSHQETITSISFISNTDNLIPTGKGVGVYLQERRLEAIQYVSILLGALTNNTFLETLNIRVVEKSSISEDDFANLITVITKNTNLSNLELTGLLLSGNQERILLEALDQCPLKSLSLCDTRTTVRHAFSRKDNSLAHKDNPLGRILQKNPLLTQFQYSHNQLSKKELVNIFSFFLQPTNETQTKNSTLEIPSPK